MLFVRGSLGLCVSRRVLLYKKNTIIEKKNHPLKQKSRDHLPNCSPSNLRRSSHCQFPRSPPRLSWAVVEASLFHSVRVLQSEPERSPRTA
jgi:hypothetical protein